MAQRQTGVAVVLQRAAFRVPSLPIMSDSDEPEASHHGRQNKGSTPHQPDWLNPVAGSASSGSVSLSSAWTWMSPAASKSHIPHTPAHRTQLAGPAVAMATAKAIARAAEAAAVATKRAAEMSAAAAAEMSGGDLPVNKKPKESHTGGAGSGKGRKDAAGSGDSVPRSKLESGDGVAGDHGRGGSGDSSRGRGANRGRGGERRGGRGGRRGRGGRSSVQRSDRERSGSPAAGGESEPFSPPSLETSYFADDEPDIFGGSLVCHHGSDESGEEEDKDDREEESPASAASAPAAAKASSAASAPAAPKATSPAAAKASPAPAPSAPAETVLPVHRPKSKALGRGTKLTFAGRYPPADGPKRARFLGERQWWLDWRQSISEGGYWVCDCQENFYKFLRSKIALDAEDYDERIETVFGAWKKNTMSDSL